MADNGPERLAALVERAKDAVQKVHGYTDGVTQDQTLDALREINEEIDVMISSLEEDAAGNIDDKADEWDDDEDDLDDDD